MDGKSLMTEGKTPWKAAVEEADYAT